MTTEASEDRLFQWAKACTFWLCWRLMPLTVSIRLISLKHICESCRPSCKIVELIFNAWCVLVLSQPQQRGLKESSIFHSACNVKHYKWGEYTMCDNSQMHGRCLLCRIYEHIYVSWTTLCWWTVPRSGTAEKKKHKKGKKHAAHDVPANYERQWTKALTHIIKLIPFPKP